MHIMVWPYIFKIAKADKIKVAEENDIKGKRSSLKVVYGFLITLSLS